MDTAEQSNKMKKALKPLQNKDFRACGGSPSETWSPHSLGAHRDSPCFFTSPPCFIVRRTRIGGSPRAGTGAFVLIFNKQKQTPKRMSVFVWRRRRDSNSRAGYPTYALRRVDIFNKKVNNINGFSF